MAVLTARAGELESEFAWGVVRQLFDGVVARAPAEERARLLDGAAALARPALGIEATQNTADAPYATLHGLYGLAVNVAHRRPALLAVDDLHWADSPSLRFFTHLLPRIAELPILLLMASRPPGAQPAPGSELLARIMAEPALMAVKPAALGGIPLAARARAELTIAGARPRRDALRGRDALTPSELRVAQLAAEGRTNREIAEHLFITLRTVEAHLTSSYGKLDIASRQQLAAALGSSTS